MEQKNLIQNLNVVSGAVPMLAMVVENNKGK